MFNAVTSMDNSNAGGLQKPLRILIVEDHAPTRMAMTRLIRQAGAEVVAARDGKRVWGISSRSDLMCC